jgi:signal transduction histidine kinase
VINGIKFTEHGGRIALGWSLRKDGGLALHVRDTGVGMSADDAKRVLQPFGRGSALLARARHDTGLGLPLCKRFVEMHGGTLHIASALGQGTTVSAIFPAGRVTLGGPPALAA